MRDNRTIRRRPRVDSAAGFTVLELLVTVGVIAILMAVLLPALRSARASAKAYKCQVTLRDTAFAFSIFADPLLHGDRGDDTRFGANRFSLETFVESQYCVDEFWCYGSDTDMVTSDANRDPLRCDEVRGEVVFRRNAPCRAGGVGPPQNVSFGFNSRLLIAETLDKRGRPRAKEVQLTGDITTHPRVPLVWDVDGQEAFERGVAPFFSAPSLDSRGPYANDRYWWPSARHSGKANYALVDGSVHASERPLDTTHWNWSFQARP